MARPLYRRPTNKRSSAKNFRRNTTKTKAANLKAPNRGGYRL